MLNNKKNNAKGNVSEPKTLPNKATTQPNKGIDQA